MENQTFMLIGGLIIASMGFTYIVSERFALTFFYHRRFGIRNILTYFLSESAGVSVIRFGLGPILLIAGSWLVVIALGSSPI